MPLDERFGEYRRIPAATTPPFLLARRFVAAESWTKATTQEGTRYLGLFREHEPDLAAILVHRQLLILGEPGAGNQQRAAQSYSTSSSTDSPRTSPFRHH